MKRRIIPYEAPLKKRARWLRKNATLAEVLLWNRLEGGQMMGCDFHRQKPLDRYIVDFYCKELRLAIAIDGSSHELEGAYERDQQRQRRLEHLGVAFLRFDDRAVKQDMDGVLEASATWIDATEAEDAPDDR